MVLERSQTTIARVDANGRIGGEASIITRWLAFRVTFVSVKGP